MAKGNKSLNHFFSNNAFLGSFYEIKKLPKENDPEFCFIGRSNVGKSSIINSITKTKKLAKVSKTPGRTQSINFYKINSQLNIIDLPGYGYAKVSLEIQKKLSELIEIYLLYRNNIKKIYVLIDCKVGLKNLDINILNFIIKNEKAFSIIFTKTDKCSQNLIKEQEKSINSFFKSYNQPLNNFFYTSSKNMEGILDVQKDIYTLTRAK